MKTYTVIQESLNSGYIDKTGKYNPTVLWDCGHKHRSIKTVAKCLKQLDNTTRSIGACIIDNTGRKIDDSVLYDALYEIEKCNY